MDQNVPDSSTGGGKEDAVMTDVQSEAGASSVSDFIAIRGSVKEWFEEMAKIDPLVAAIPPNIVEAQRISAETIVQEDDNASSICRPIVDKDPDLRELLISTFRKMRIRLKGTTSEWCGSRTAKCLFNHTCILHYSMAHLAEKQEEYPPGCMIHARDSGPRIEPRLYKNHHPSRTQFT